MVTLVAIAGLLLFGLGATTGHLTQKAEQEYPPKGRIVDAGGIRQHVIERTANSQQAAVVVMIHGAYEVAENFTLSLMPPLEGRFHTVAIDRPGHGYTERGPDTPVPPDKQARYLDAALRALNIDRPVILLGFSYGGAVALSYALQFPERVSAMVLVSPATHPYNKSPVSLSDLTSAPLLGPLLRHTIVTPTGTLLIDSGVERVFAPETVPQAYRDAPVPLSVRPGSYAANSEDIDVLSDFLGRQAPNYPQLRMPIFIVANDDDRTVSPSLHGRKLAAAKPGTELILTDGGGHPLHFSRTSVVLDAIERAAQVRR